MTNIRFDNANEAYEFLLNQTIEHGEDFDDTKAIFNCGFYIMNPQKNHITNKERKWSLKYAEAEWQWYLSGDPSISKLGELYGKIPPIWEKMADSLGNVRSNYGWQWKRNAQIDYVTAKLKTNPKTRHAAISIFDGKEFDTYRNDTPCTYAVQFTIINDKLCMSVYMRSNDIWYGFCNDQYQFSSLQKMVADRLNLEIGWYYHHAHNMHLYNNKL
jgi:thymidylate synthase|tara:strand:+ start:476 stop:1120 length:645 start_codon:yes stop_codon:yes gene_type:complete